MAWHALSALDDARRATKSVLFPVDRGRWVRLALLSFFVGSVSSSGSGGGQAPLNFSGEISPGDVPTPGPGPVTIPPFDGRLLDTVADSSLALLVSVGVILTLLSILVYAAVGSVMEFVLVDGLRDGDVRIRGPFRAYLRAGVRLFAFRVIVVVLAASPVVLAAAAFLVGVSVSPAFVLLLLPVAFLVAVLALVVSVVLQLTTDFVVPTMLAENCGVVDAWRRLLPIFRADWEQVALYALVRYAVAVGAAITVGLVVVLLALVVALPFVLVGGLLYVLLSALGGLGPAGVLLFGLVAVLYGAVVFAVSVLVQVPVVTYLRYYALFVLGALDESLDLVASFRVVDVP